MDINVMKSMPRVHVLKVTILPATNRRVIRVKIESLIWKQSVIAPMNNTPGSDIPKVEAAINWCEANNFPVIGWENGNTHAFIVTSLNKPLK